MTRAEAEAEAGRRQREHADSTWIAVERDGEWSVASIGLAPRSHTPLSAAVKPPPPTPHEPVQSELQRVATQYGAGG